MWGLYHAQGIYGRRVSHSFPAFGAVFDGPNLVSCRIGPGDGAGPACGSGPHGHRHPVFDGDR